MTRPLANREEDALPDDFTLVLVSPSLKANVKADFAFRVLDRKGQAVKKYEIRHEKPLHLILVSRDLNLFRHVHPTLGADGTWQLTLDPLPVGPYRAYADCQPVNGPVLALGADFAVARPLPPPSRTKTVDGYKVALDGTLAAGGMSMLTMTVRRSGHPVTDLEPYLGALGHLVTIAASDLSYLHVHPMEMPVGPGQVMFHIVFPAAGTYRLFFQFQHGGVVRTAPFTVEVAGSGGGDGGHGGHD
jgi:hypothetical protein